MSARIVVGQGSCGLAAGAGAVYTALEQKLNAEVKSIFDFKYEDFKLENYNPHDAIKADVSI